MSKPVNREGMNQHEINFIEQAQAGDARAFEELMRLHDHRVLQVAQGILGNLQDAADAYQNTMVRAFMRIHTFRFESSFATWLTRIAINQSLNLRKKRRWHRRFSLDHLAGTEAEPRAETTHPADRMMQVVLSERIRQSLEHLSDRERAVFVLKHMHGYKIREIALMIDCADGTVKNYLFRATRKLRTVLKPYYEDLTPG